MTEKPTPRTWAQQQEYERQVRREWLQSVADTGMSKSEAARYLGMDRGGLFKMCKKSGVVIDGARRQAQARREAAEAERIAKIEAKREMERNERKLEELRDQVLQRKSAIMAEGYTEAQALRAIAHQMGVYAHEIS